MIAFDQGAFLADPSAHGLDSDRPRLRAASCAQGATCRVHVAFHGCQQTDALIGDRFRTETGYNRWADTNDLIVLYPQAHRTLVNPNACWDWWGYDDAQHATRNGRQMAAVRAMLDRLAGIDPFCEAHAGSNFEHWQAGRARSAISGCSAPQGSGDPIGYVFGARPSTSGRRATSAPRAAPHRKVRRGSRTALATQAGASPSPVTNKVVHHERHDSGACQEKLGKVARPNLLRRRTPARSSAAA